MNQCRTDGCDGIPIDDAIARVLGDSSKELSEKFKGLCEECAGKEQDEELTVSTWSTAKTNSEFQPWELEANKQESELFRLEMRPEKVLEGSLARIQTLDDGIHDLTYLSDHNDTSNGRLLDDRDSEIIDLAIRDSKVNSSTIARALGVHRTTISRRVRRLRSLAISRRPVTSPDLWNRIKKMAATMVGAPPPYGLEPDEYARARPLFSPKKAETSNLRIERLANGTVAITGHGQTPPDLREALRDGSIERIYERRRCRCCNHFLPRQATGKPRKYCNEGCRNRYRRRK